jgi:hypothetical protein
MTKSKTKLRRFFALGLALATAATSAAATAQGDFFQLTGGDDTLDIFSLDDVAKESVLDAGDGLDTLNLTNLSLAQLVVDQGTVLIGWENVVAEYESPVVEDALGIGAVGFNYSYSAYINLGIYYFELNVIDTNGKVVAAIKIDVEEPGTQKERISLRIKQGKHKGTLTAVGGEVVVDNLSDHLRNIYDWAIKDGGFEDPIPSGDKDPEAILACFVLGPGSVPCVVGTLVAISLFCCENPNGPGA